MGEGGGEAESKCHALPCHTQSPAVPNRGSRDPRGEGQRRGVAARPKGAHLRMCRGRRAPMSSLQMPLAFALRSLCPALCRVCREAKGLCARIF